jgi:membrane fusion protein (multidrug efflux system)
MTIKSIVNLRNLLLATFFLALCSLAVGCGGSDAAETSGDASGAEPASNTSDSKKDVNDGEESAADDAEDDEEAVPVEVASLVRGPIESVLRSSANLEAENHVQVFSQASRLVRELLVEEGDRVARDQVLLRLQDEEQRNALTKVRSQLDKARREYDRQQRLFDQQLISEQVFTDATHELEQIEIALSDAERELGYTEVRAPISGTITARVVMLGDQIQTGQHLFDIVDFDSIVARIYVPEKNLQALRSGQPARILAQAIEGREYDGVVKRIAPIVDARSGTVKVTVAVGRQPGLLPGMYVDVDLVTATHTQAVLVPKRALVYDDDEVFVYRLADDRRVERIHIEPMLADKRNIEPRGGLTAGDEVVIAGQAGLKDGARVSLPGDEDTDEEPDAAAESVLARSAG